MNKSLYDIFQTTTNKLSAALVVICFFVGLIVLIILYWEKTYFLELQGYYFAQSIRADLIKGDHVRVYEICRSIFSDNTINSLKVLRGNEVFCDMTQGSNFLTLGSETDLFFDPAKGHFPENTFGKINVGVSARALAIAIISIVISFVVMAISLLRFSWSNHKIFETKIINPLNNFSKLLTNHPRNRERILMLERESESYEITNLSRSYLSLVDQLELKERELAEEVKRSTYVSVARKVAHDIRSPISALSLVASRIKSLDPKETRLISQALHRITAIADDLLNEYKQNNSNEPILNFTRNTTPENETVNIVHVVKNVVLEMQVIINENGNISIQTYFPDGELLVLGSEKSYSRIISNIIINSIEAIEARGFITVTITTLNRECIIEIRDNGVGLEEKHVYQLNASPRSINKEKGNGIGLASAKEYVESIGGTITLHSKKGVGTTVSLRIPQA